MDETRSPLDALQRHRPELLISADDRARWVEALEIAASAHSGFSLSEEVLADAIARRLPANQPLAEGLAGLDLADIALAAALETGVPAAMAAFDELAGAAFDQAIRAVRGSRAVEDELRSRVMVRVLGPRGEGAPAPAIRGYGGRSSLRSWLRVIAIREAIKLVTTARRDPATSDDALYTALAPDVGPEIQYMKALYREQVREAFTAALAGLTDKQRVLFRQAILDELTLDQLAPLHGVGRSTVGRWLVAARADLARKVRAELAARLDIPARDVDSILRLVKSQLDITLGPLRDA